MRPIRRFQLALVLGLLALGALMTVGADDASAASSPTITSVTPAQGTVVGGTPVTITGTDFQSGVRVYIGGREADSMLRVSDTQVTLRTPPGANASGGGANVLVVNSDGGAVSLASGFFYTAFESPLAITALDPASGPNSGGTTITVTGTGFSSAAAVYFGDVPATLVNRLGASSMFVRAPANVSGAVPVTIVNPDGTRATRANGFTYVGGVSVERVTPGGGPPAGGTVITIAGSGFAPGATVRVGDVPATAVLVVNSTQIVTTTPAGAVGSAPVVVTNPNGQSGAREQGFAYGPRAGATPPAILNVSPNSGPSLGGTQVSIGGSDISGGVTVYFGSVLAPSVTWNGASSIFTQAPANAPGPVSITLVNSDGASHTLPNAYTYQGGQGTTVVSVSPSSGPAGTVVTINGTGFNPGSWVTFNGVAGTSSTVVGTTQMVATVPAGLSGSVAVGVTQVGGQSAARPDGFTVASGTAAPAPAPAPPVGGTGVFVAPPVFSASGQALVIFGGGSVDQLEAAASAGGARGAWVQEPGGAYQLLVVGGPAFLKDQFKARFTAGLGANTVATLTR